MRILHNITARPVGALAFGADRLVAGGSGGFDVYDLAADTRSHFASHFTMQIFACVIDPRGRWLYFADTWAGCRLLPLDEAGPGRLPGEADAQHVVGLAVSPDGGKVVVSRTRNANVNRVECWEVGDPWRLAWAFRDGEPCGEGPHYSAGRNWWTFAVAFSPDGRHVAAMEYRTSLDTVHRRSSPESLATPPGSPARGTVWPRRGREDTLIHQPLRSPARWHVLLAEAPRRSRRKRSRPAASPPTT